MATAATGEPIQWDANGHYYEAISGGQAGFTWYEADQAARSRIYNGAQGHLVTLTSQAENELVVSTFLNPLPEPTMGAYWLGGYQPADSAEPDGGWRWVTPEPWAWTNWAPAEPNNSNFGSTMPSEDGLTYVFGDPSRLGKWNDCYRCCLL